MNDFSSITELEEYEGYEIEKNTGIKFCYACRGSGKSYWDGGIYGTCLLCCCILCSNFEYECDCNYCEKCEDTYEKDGEHICYQCEKCGGYEIVESLLKNHCKVCSCCNKRIRFLREDICDDCKIKE